MDGSAAGIDCSHSGGGKNDIPFRDTLCYILEEGCLARSGLPGKVYRFPGLPDIFFRSLKNCILFHGVEYVMGGSVMFLLFIERSWIFCKELEIDRKVVLFCFMVCSVVCRRNCHVPLGIFRGICFRSS